MNIRYISTAIIVASITFVSVVSASEEMKSDEAKAWMAYSIITSADADLGRDLMTFNSIYIENCNVRLMPTEAKKHPLFAEMQYMFAKKKQITKEFYNRLC